MKAHLFGLVAEFATPEGLLAAARAAHRAGYRHLDGYTPHPVEGLAEAIGFRRTRMPLVVLLGGITGAVTAYGMQWYSAVHDYALNVGGRPLHSWPSFIPITFELTVLFAALSGVVGMLALNGLPSLYHPVFHALSFREASQTSFFLCLEAADPIFRADEARRFLESCQPVSIEEVER